ncbi:MAG: cytochrome b/b6 domain-containing protein [Siculibacillus sp.]|nr:cytochrome b/b6 domain-containing protein [Siculibacillus sp.]
MTDTTAPSAAPAKVLAWDLPTRLFKWALVVAIAVGWASDKLGGGNPDLHVLNGRIVLTLVVFRVLWGFVGGSTARFSGFVPSPGNSVSYGLALLRGREGHYLGHNPLGAWMVLVLLALSGAMALTGLFNADVDRMIVEGPLAKTVADATVTLAHKLHHRIFDVLLICIGLHVAAVAFHAVVKKERLVPAMVTGRKPAAAYADARAATPGAIGLALACLAAAAAIVWLGIRAAGG